jgi:hypothetical protein
MWEPIDRQYLLQKGDQLTKFQLAKLKKSRRFCLLSKTITFLNFFFNNCSTTIVEYVHFGRWRINVHRLLFHNSLKFASLLDSRQNRLLFFSLANWNFVSWSPLLTVNRFPHTSRNLWKYDSFDIYWKNVD